MSPTLVALVTFVSAALLFAALGSLATDLFVRDRLRINNRFREEFGNAPRTDSRRSGLFKDLRLVHAETARAEKGLWQRFQMMVEQSNVGITPPQLLLISLAVAVVFGLAAAAVTRSWLPGLAATAVGCLCPVLYVGRQRAARIHKLCLQLPAAFELMSRAVRAGQTMSGAMQLVATQAAPPISQEFGLCCEQQNLGLPQEVAFKDLARRTGVMELQMFVVAVLVQRQSGGNPVEILNNLAAVIRKRLRLVGRVKALTGEGRMQAVVLAVLPVVAFAALFALNRSYAQILLDRPLVLAGTFCSELLGVLWIRKIINFDY